MKRIDPADAPALFRRTGLRPEQFSFYRKDRGHTLSPCGCLTTALLLDALPAGERDAVSECWWFPPTDDGPRRSGAEMLAARCGFTRQYVCGLVSGWDGGTDEEIEEIISRWGDAASFEAEYRAGIADGREAWDAVAAERRKGGKP